ncbi:hypothetical protein LMG31506_01257 [Cupriavidus yeoncheonensis]|uniref:Uncharacterized protein n=1 Tax=Cupriavidus yeoncheonensis TaxID=1462994 RepID=A0A916N2F6_9BURK|nr:hypothetical protein LMG31506_01257 [Cupriavidus yeoncheonensis]
MHSLSCLSLQSRRIAPDFKSIPRPDPWREPLAWAAPERLRAARDRSAKCRKLTGPGPGAVLPYSARMSARAATARISGSSFSTRALTAAPLP